MIDIAAYLGLTTLVLLLLTTWPEQGQLVTIGLLIGWIARMEYDQ